MQKLLAELKRRQMFRVAAAYAVVAWLTLQVVNNVAPVLDLPPWVARAFLLLLVIGFPIALLFVWMHELAPTDGAAARAATTRLDYVLVGSLLFVIVLVAYGQLTPPSATGTAQQGTVVGSPAPQAQAGGISIAVLPFVNLSDDRAQEFFSDGITEEITAALAQVAGWRVIGRTSAFEFKGQNRDLRMIGQALGATHLIEGSVRKAGNRVRITAQLVKADDNSHLWVQSYDRELTDVFAIQEDIAQSIATSLRVPLGVAQGDTLVRNRITDEATYENYLRARALVRARGLGPLTEAARLLEQVVAQEPDFAPAWALLGLDYALTPVYDPAWASGASERARPAIDASIPKSEAAANRAVQLDPRSPDAYVALALVQHATGKFSQAWDSYSRAFALDADHPDVLHLESMMLADLGYVRQALRMRQRLQVLEPFVPVFANLSGRVMWLAGETDRAVAALNSAAARAYVRANIDLSRIYSAQGRYNEAADLMEQFPPDAYDPRTVEAAARLLRSAPAVAASPQTLPQLGLLGFAYIYAGAPERALEFYEGNLKLGYLGAGTIAWQWAPAYGDIRKMERFKALVRNAGMVDYWKAHGWPDLCRPVGADDFVCD